MICGIFTPTRNLITPQLRAIHVSLMHDCTQIIERSTRTTDFVLSNILSMSDFLYHNTQLIKVMLPKESSQERSSYSWVSTTIVEE
jgi:dsDNA-specific endonuclease/ATPase MutS2